MRGSPGCAGPVACRRSPRARTARGDAAGVVDLDVAEERTTRREFLRARQDEHPVPVTAGPEGLLGDEPLGAVELRPVCPLGNPKTSLPSMAPQLQCWWPGRSCCHLCG